MSATALLREGATLRSVRLRGGADDAGEARRRLERALSDVDWSPAGLPPRGLLFVRRLRADGRRWLRPHSEGGSFGRGVSAALREHAAAARRPWLNDDAAQADAVLFVDEAELLACLWRDWARGHVALRWWWRSVLGDQDVATWLRLKAWPRGEWLVPALAQLAERRDAVVCVARLAPPDVERALQAVRAAYGLVHVGALAAASPASGDPLPAPVESDASLKRDAPPSLATMWHRVVALVPEVMATGLAPAQRRLLALALGVTRAPAWARTAEFAVAMAENASTPVEVAPVTTPPQRVERRDGGPSPSSGMQRDGGREEVSTPTPPTTPHEDAAPTRDVKAPVETAKREVSEAPGQHQAEANPIETHAPTVSAPRAMPPAAQPSDTVLPAATKPHALRTRYGGLFYLLNAALALRLYGDFTMPRHPGLALSPWDLLAWTGRAWFGDDFVRDPLWPLLATLSGRAPNASPGDGFDAPADWAIDPSWLAPWGTVALSVHATRRRLRVLHPQGFAVFDVARHLMQTPLNQARALCGESPLRRARPPFARVPRRASQRWLHHWLAYLDARLRHTLEAETDVPALLCRHDAEVRVDAGHVDVHLALANLPLALRFAGLDRDPGWIPAAGRSMSFHFE